MNIYKKEYISPEICRIQLDNEISLALASTENINPSDEPNWSSQNQNNMPTNPFKNQLV